MNAECRIKWWLEIGRSVAGSCPGGYGGNGGGRGGSRRSLQVNQDDPITSDHIRPNPTKSNQIKPEKSELRWRVKEGTPGSHKEHRWCDVLDGTAEKRIEFSNLLCA